MNAPGSPSSPLQTTYFDFALGGADSRPFQAGRKARPAAAAQPARLDLLDDLMRRELFQAAAQRREAVVPQVFVQIERIDLAAMLGGQVLLRPEKRADRPVAGVDGVPGRRVAGFIGQQPIEPARGRAADAAQRPRGLKWASTMSAASSALTLAKSRFSPAADGRRDFHQRRLVAHADAADPFHHGRARRFRPVRPRSPDKRGRFPGRRSTSRARRESRPRLCRERSASAGRLAVPLFCCCRKSSITSPTIAGASRP